ncbi:MAG: NAD(P)/FAD-dependent oxidoreductase [Gemmatimonadota bacterium]
MKSSDLIQRARPRVVIVGAGFGGLQCARRLANEPVDVMLIDRNNYHLFTPLLYQVASSLLNPSEIAIPIRSVVSRARNVRFRLGTMTGVDFNTRHLQISGADIAYDYLVLALGCATNYFNLDPRRDGLSGVKDLPEALALRNRVLEQFEIALTERDEEKQAQGMTFVIVGGGPTGVEYAGALAELFRRVLDHDFPELDLTRARVILIEGLDRLLTDFPPPLGDYARKRLEELGVEVRLGSLVQGYQSRVAHLDNGERISAGTLIWAAGVQPTCLTQQLALPRTTAGRVEVDDSLRAAGQDRVYAIGDMAAVRDASGLLPMMAPPAMQAGRHAAENILHDIRDQPLQAFRYRDKGIMATIGRNAGVARIGRFKLRGFVGWIAWLLIHLYFLIGFRNRVAVLLQWGWNYFKYDRPIRIITRSEN